MNFDKKNIRAVMIVEVLGRPPEHLVGTLEDIAKKMGEEKGVKVVGNKISPPVLMKEQKEFYTSFAEIEVEVEEILYLAILMFKYMPANIEIISPENISLPNSGWNDILNELTRRLHGYEELARIMQTEKMILENRLKEMISAPTEEKPKKKKK
ncbi:MAG: hypothetical protein PHQ66_03430 [Candidatus Nanoarchaeia archaeon]|nr:hypothetical protein [Candidatus Nanoarchaeia archaeon]MDD5357586.1 hypothetical protein [Candidatus Nanoarchaeia archaeon]MDD5588505.1 hypothetical protein [Candidatus Nanoarchaeia archaeon]